MLNKPHCLSFSKMLRKQASFFVACARQETQELDRRALLLKEIMKLA